MTPKPRIAVIIGSTRKSRFGDKPAEWIADRMKARDDIEVELLDLRDFDLPFFDEMASNAWMPSQSEKAVAWQNKLAEFDGYVFVTPEYNRSISGALKNALDQAYVEWNRKPMGVVSYGAVGGTRAAEHLRMIAVELQMVPVRAGVHIGGEAFRAVHPMGQQNQPMSAIEPAIGGSADGMLEDLVWWAKATMAARADSGKAAA